MKRNTQRDIIIIITFIIKPSTYKVTCVGVVNAVNYGSAYNCLISYFLFLLFIFIVFCVFAYLCIEASPHVRASNIKIIIITQSNATDSKVACGMRHAVDY